MTIIERAFAPGRLDAALDQTICRNGTREVRARDVIDLFLDAGMRPLIAGGAPRDWLIDQPGKDIDLCLDRPIEEAHRLLRAAYPGMGTTLLHNERFGTLRWGEAGIGWVDINILRSWKDIRNDDMWSTDFVVRSDLVEDALMRDFSVNAFYYDCRDGSLIDPLQCGIADLQTKTLRLITHRRVLDTSFRTTFRILQFLCRGYVATDSVLEHLAQYADHDIQGMGARLHRWIPNHFGDAHAALETFRQWLYAHARQPASIQTLDAYFKQDPYMHTSTTTATTPAPFRQTFQAGMRDDHHRLLGGTEVLHLVRHGGRLFASLSYKLNAYLPDDPDIGAQIIALDQPGDGWRLVHDFERAHWRVTLESVTFTRDGRGRTLDTPASVLLAGPSDSRGMVCIDSLDDGTGTWVRTPLGNGAGVASIRSFFVYRDKVTGLERVFAGTVPLGIISGTYDPDTPGRIRWDDAPELAGFTRRAMAFTECNGQLYASIKPDIYRRIDGDAPRWEKVYTIPVPLIVPSSGLRGLTTVPRPSGDGEVLLAALEGDRCRVVRIDPEDDFRETVELDVLDFLGEHWGERPTYAVVAYDDFTPVTDPRTDRTRLFTGLGATYSTQLDTHPADGWVRDAWYLIRDPDGERYTLHRIESPDVASANSQPRPELVAARSIAVSPFEPGMLYIGGYDPNAKPCRQTAWIYSVSIEAALASPSR